MTAYSAQRPLNVHRQAPVDWRPTVVQTRQGSWRPLMDLGHCQCRYPVAEDASVPGCHLFCAAATTADRRYCAEHLRVVTAVDQRRGGSGQLWPAKRAA